MRCVSFWRRTIWFGLGLGLGVCPSLSVSLAGDPLGQDLFVRKWVSHDPRSGSGDGLGPMHNATSCVACHHQAGPGGGGGREHNVELLSVVPPKGMDNARDRQRFTDRLAQLHPGFVPKPGSVVPNLVLHRFGPEADYFEFRAKLLDREEPRADMQPGQRAIAAAAVAKRRGKERPVVETLVHDDVKLQLTQRNTPALWGAGLIDSIPEMVLEALAKSQAKEFPELSGRVPRSATGSAGRFGWRGQTSRLQQFVLAACANELGLQTVNNAQPANPLAAHYSLIGQDLSAGDLDLLVSFVANLPRPVQREPRNSVEREALALGALTFDRIGCNACHTQHVGHVEDLFSDLLLHDMGPAFDDPVEPNPPTRKVTREGFAGGYSGGGRIFVSVDEEFRPPELAREWRTPPLWGVADSAPYLHDGRADTLAEAILLHGGEAAPAARRFRELPGDQRAALIVLLESLVAPPLPIR
jgi:CxxC motif-containing protein (DUF1111 family)